MNICIQPFYRHTTSLVGKVRLGMAGLCECITLKTDTLFFQNLIAAGYEFVTPILTTLGMVILFNFSFSNVCSCISLGLL
jgi:hypothetical protein